MPDLTPLADRALAEMWDRLSKDERQLLLDRFKIHRKFKYLTMAELPFIDALAAYLSLWPYTPTREALRHKLLDYYSKTAIDVSGQKR